MSPKRCNRRRVIPMPPSGLRPKNEHPILFGDPMVRAILAGIKTQTRREIRGAHIPGFRCPYGKPGDRLWVREAWRIVGDSPEDTLDMFDIDDVQYRADDDQSYIDRYRPSIHMPRRFSRITLEVTGVRVERLQDISEADAIAEGIERSGECNWVDYLDYGHNDFTSARRCYRSLWEQINGTRSWNANPLVWVVEFRRCS